MTGRAMKRTNTNSNEKQTKPMTGRTMKRTNTISSERQTRQWKKLVEKSNVEHPTTNDMSAEILVSVAIEVLMDLSFPLVLSV
jgi:hypothetical protein